MYSSGIDNGSIFYFDLSSMIFTVVLLLLLLLLLCLLDLVVMMVGSFLVDSSLEMTSKSDCKLADFSSIMGLSIRTRVVAEESAIQILGVSRSSSSSIIVDKPVLGK